MIVNATMAAALKKSVDEGYKLKISAEMNTVDSDTPISITPDDIQQNTFSIDRYVQTGNTLEVGSACSSELKFIVYNGEKFKGVTFEGAEVIVSGTIPVENSDGEWVDTTVNLGTFTIDEKPRSLALVQIVALDDMVKLDKPCTISDTGTMKTLILSMASECGVNVDTTSLNTCFNAYNNITVTLKFSSETVPTYRQVLSWICQLGLCNAYINVDGYLAFKGFTSSTVSAKITADDRYTHTIEEKAIGFKELTFSEDDLTVTIPQGGNTTAENCIVLDFSKNPLFKPFYEKLSAITGVFTVWKNKLKTFAYIPFSANIRNFFWLEPMDKITFAKEGTNYETLIMHTTLCPGKAMKIEAKGESPTKSGYAAVNPLTAQEQKILDDLRRFVTAETAKVTDREYQLIEFNKAINSGMALHKTTVNGVEYYHDQEDITLSDYIMVQNSAGVAWTDSGWNSGSPVWKYGISSNGEAILNSVDAYKIRADLITVTDLKAFGATIGGWNIGEGRIWVKGLTAFLPYTEVNSYLHKNTGELVNTSLNVKLTDYIRVSPQEKYIYTGSGTNGSVVASVVWYSETKNFVSANQSFGEKQIFTVPNGCYYARFQAYTSANSTKETLLEVKKQQTYEEKYTFFSPITSESDPVWASGAESLDSYDNAGFILYGDGRVRMGGNLNTGYLQARDNVLQFWGGNTNASAELQFFLTSYRGDNEFSFVGCRENEDENFVFYSGRKPFLYISNDEGTIKTNYQDFGYGVGGDVFAGLRHYRGTVQYTAYADFGVGNPGNKPSIGIELRQQKTDEDNNTYYEIKSRIDIYENPETSGEALVNLKVSDGSSFTPLEFAANKIWYRGNMNVNGVDVSSTESIKTNIASTDSVLDLFSAESSQIYSYNLKKTVITETEEGSGGDVSTDGDGVIIEEQVEETTSYGFVIGDGYAVPEQVLNKDGNAINLYSMAALTWKAVQELYLKIKALEGNTNAE